MGFWSTFPFEAWIIIVVLGVGAIGFFVLTLLGARRIEEARDYIKGIEELLGVPLRETDLVPGEQYLRLDISEGMIFIKRVGTVVEDNRIRAVSFNSSIEGSIPPNTVFSVIQTEDGRRLLFSKKSELRRASVKASDTHN